MKRNLCYRHHTAEFDKLSNAMRHLAADWRTVKPCEMCKAERADLLAKLEALAEEWESKPYTGDYTQAAYAICGNKLRVALAGARGEGVDNHETADL